MCCATIVALLACAVAAVWGSSKTGVNLTLVHHSQNGRNAMMYTALCGNDTTGETWFFGGSADEKCEYNGLVRFSPDRNFRYEQLDANATYRPSSRTWSTLCVNQLFAVVFGGQNCTKEVEGDTWLFSLQNKKWLRWPDAFVEHFKDDYHVKRLASPRGRYGAAYWCSEGDLMVFGGKDGAGELLSDMWRFDSRALVWRQLSSYGHSLTNDTLASANDCPSPTSTRTAFPTPGFKLTAITGTKPQIRMLRFSDANSVSEPNQQQRNLYLLGGNTEKRDYVRINADLWSYSQTSCAWHLLRGQLDPDFGKIGIPHTLNMPSARLEPAVWADHMDNLIVFGGKAVDSGGQIRLLPDLWKYEHCGNAWVFLGNISVLEEYVNPTLHFYFGYSVLSADGHTKQLFLVSLNRTEVSESATVQQFVYRLEIPLEHMSFLSKARLATSTEFFVLMLLIGAGLVALFMTLAVFHYLERRGVQLDKAPLVSYTPLGGSPKQLFDNLTTPADAANGFNHVKYAQLPQADANDDEDADESVGFLRYQNGESPAPLATPGATS